MRGWSRTELTIGTVAFIAWLAFLVYLMIWCR